MAQLIHTVLLDRYRVLEALAAGGTSVLYRGVDQRTGKPVAIKVTDRTLFPPGEASKRIAIEALAAQRLDHPNIIKTLAYGEDHRGNAVLVMELLSGSSLQHLLNQRPQLNPAETLRLVLPLLDAMGYAHERGVIHRDIKPANIFLSRSANGSIVPKLLDFGIAVLAQMTRLTRSGVMLGTLPYVAPEQILMGQVTAQSDVWSMGVVLFRCLSGHLPHAPADDSIEVLVRIAREPPLRLRAMAPHLGVRLCAAVDRALEHHLDRRYADMQEFVKALHNAMGRDRHYGSPARSLSSTPTQPNLREEDPPTVALQAPPLRLPNR